MIGQTIDRYRIVAKLGEGGMGSVWEAEDPVLGRRIALKFLPDALVGSTAARERFLREARAASMLQHPGIATVHDIREADGRVFIAMQRVEGMTVHDAVANGTLEITEALRIAIEVGTALQHAHEHGVVHRDVSARNIMLAKDGKVVIVDFGLAVGAEHTRQTKSGAVIGTVGYLAPEVVQGSAADARSDLYSLGVVLFEMLAGRLPFEADRQEALLYQVVHESVVPPSRFNPKVPASLDRVVLKSLAKDPAQRYESLDGFVLALRENERVMGPATVGARGPGGSSRRIDPRVRRRRQLYARLAIIGLSLVAVSAFAWRTYFHGQGLDAPIEGTIAVLPFQNQSPDAGETRYLGPGLAERLAAKLTRVSGLKVVPWWSSQRYGDASMPLTEIATQLGADVLIVGTFARQEGRILGSIALVDGDTGVQRWVEEFDEPWSGVLALQERVSLGLARRLKGDLGEADEIVLTRPLAKNWEALEEVLKGSEAIGGVDSRGSDLNETAASHFEKALELDPDLVEAHIGLGATQHNRYFFGWGGYGELQASEASHLRALRLDPASLEARSGLARAYWEKGLFDKCLQLAQEVARLGGEGVEAQLVLAEIYFLGGLLDVSNSLFEQITARDPGAAIAHWFLVGGYSFDSRWEKAIAAGEHFLAAFGPDAYIHGQVGMAYQALGQLDRAQEHYGAMMQLAGDDTYFYGVLGRLHHDLGDEETARWVWNRSVRIVRSQLDRFPDNHRYRAIMAESLAYLGDRSGFEQERDLILREDPYGISMWIVMRGEAILGDIDAAVALTRRACMEHGCFKGAICYIDWGDLVSAEDRVRLGAEITQATERMRRAYGPPEALP